MSKKPKKQRPRIYLTVRKVADLETGVECWALIPTDAVQRSAMRERGFQKNALVACDVYPERNVSQWRKAHVLGRFLVENVEGFATLDAHSAIKKVQNDGGVECETETFEIPGIPGEWSRRVAKSLSFDSMGQDVFDRVMRELADYIARTYFPGMDADQVEEMVKLMPEAT